MGTIINSSSSFSTTLMRTTWDLTNYLKHIILKVHRDMSQYFRHIYRDLFFGNKTGEKDGHYFLKILEEQSIRLLALADSVDSDIDNPNLSEEIIGKLRSASGKAKLLVSQKMQQFKGLCTNNINQCAGEAFPTTNQDLQGFWDMVMLQVDQVDKIFEEINSLRDNNWIEETIKTNEVKRNGLSKARKTISKPKVTAAAEETRKQREEQRKKIIEDRRKAMKAQQSSQPSIKIFVPESS